MVMNLKVDVSKITRNLKLVQRAAIPQAKRNTMYKYFTEDELKCRHTGECNMDDNFINTSHPFVDMIDMKKYL